MFGRLVLAAALAVALASAQGGMGGGGKGRNSNGDMGSQMPMRTQRQTPFELFKEKLKLSSEQASEAGNILTAAAQQASQIRTQIDKSRVDLAGAIIEGKSPDEIQKLVEAHTALQAQLDGVEADAFSKVFATLKPNQQSKAGQAFELMAGMLDRQSGGGGRRGR